jgi:hypothetical protein
MLVAPASSKKAVTHHAVGKQKKEECQDNYKQELSNPQPHGPSFFRPPLYPDQLSSEPPPQHVSTRNIALSASVRDLLGSSDRLHRNGGPVGRACDFSLLPSQLVESV